MLVLTALLISCFYCFYVFSSFLAMFIAIVLMCVCRVLIKNIHLLTYRLKFDGRDSENIASDTSAESHIHSCMAVIAI